jgi:hypothetical protein
VKVEKSYYDERNDMLAATMPIYVAKQANVYGASLEVAKACLLANAGALTAVQVVLTLLKLDLSLTTIRFSSAAVSLLFIFGFFSAMASLFFLRRWANLDTEYNQIDMIKNAASIMLAHTSYQEEHGYLEQRISDLETKASQQRAGADKMQRCLAWVQIASCACLLVGIGIGIFLAMHTTGAVAKPGDQTHPAQEIIFVGAQSSNRQRSAQIGTLVSPR